MPFFLSDFKLFFLSFLIKIAKKGGIYLPQELTWHAGPLRGCDAALRPRGRTAGGPHEAQVARTRGKKPRGSTWMPERGTRWQSGGRQLEGPRFNGPW